MASGRILILRGGAIGDFILTLPALAALRTWFPAARVEVMGYPHIARLATLGGLAHDVHPIEARALAGFFARGGDLDPATSGFFAGFDVILSYLYDPDGILRENVARCSNAQFIQGSHRPDEGAPTHATDVFLNPLRTLAIFEADPTPRIPIQRESRPRHARVAVHPGSGSESKNWPEERWRDLLGRFLAESSQEILIVGGEAEGDRLERLARGLPASRHHVARNLPLDDLARTLATCSSFIGHDSGITHLAAAVGLPSLVLWGPSNASIWRPRGNQVHILRHEHGLSAIHTDAVWSAYHETLRFPP